MKLSAAFMAAVLISMLAASISVADMKMPHGAMTLTVAGNIANSNRPAYDIKRDVSLKYHERAFDKAFAFDRAMLEGLGVTEIRIAYEGNRSVRPGRHRGQRRFGVLTHTVDIDQCLAIFGDSGRMFRRFQGMTTILTSATRSLRPEPNFAQPVLRSAPSRPNRTTERLPTRVRGVGRTQEECSAAVSRNVKLCCQSVEKLGNKKQPKN